MTENDFFNLIDKFIRSNQRQLKLARKEYNSGVTEKRMFMCVYAGKIETLKNLREAVKCVQCKKHTSRKSKIAERQEALVKLRFHHYKPPNPPMHKTPRLGIKSKCVAGDHRACASISCICNCHPTMEKE